MIANALFSRQSKAKGFTLLELLIVITILAILAVIIIFVLNPAETLKKSRDVQRMSDLATVKNAIALYMATVNTPYLGNTSANTTCKDTATTYAAGDKIWYSTPTGASTTITDTTLDGGTTTPTSNQVASTALGGIDSTGWIPVKLSDITGGSPISNYPIDPTNTVTDVANVALTDNVYRYTCDATNKAFEIDANLESDAYKNGGTSDKEATDGGNNPNLYESGTDITLLGSGATVPF